MPLLAASLILGFENLVVKDLKVGTGPAAKAGDAITVVYRGTLTNGKEFDSSKGRPPYAFLLGKGTVIKGWDQGLVGAKAGGKRRLTVPPALAYGDRGIGSDIPPKSTLVFDIDILRVEPGAGSKNLIIKDLKVGKGKAAKIGDEVALHYRGTFLNGHPFDNSYDRGRPLTFKIGAHEMVAGFENSVIGMKVGGKRKVTIPFAMAYGPQGKPPTIPPMSTLVFELELLQTR